MSDSVEAVREMWAGEPALLTEYAQLLAQEHIALLLAHIDELESRLAGLDDEEAAQ